MVRHSSAENGRWAPTLLSLVPHFEPGLAERLAKRLKRLVSEEKEERTAVNLQWIPAARYSQFWQKMSAFALTSYYDGRIRLNVIGREKRGRVATSEYNKACTQIAEVVADCRDLFTGDPIVEEIYQPKTNPHEVGPSEADLYIIWQGNPVGLSHPKFGPIGPLPYNRPGGHTGQRGFLSVVGGAIFAGSHGRASSFDVVPTIVELLGERPLSAVSGKSLAPRFTSA